MGSKTDSVGENRLRLFAFGTSDPNPENWQPWHEVEIVLAEDLESAKKIQKEHYGFATVPVVEVTKPGYIMRSPEWIEGRDF